MKIGLVGSGRWGQVYRNAVDRLSEVGESVQITHIASRKPIDPKDLKDAQQVESLKDLLRTACEAIIIATPAETHDFMIEQCIRSSKPCLVERPFCLNPKTAEQLQGLIDQTKIPVMIDHSHLFHPAYKMLKQKVSVSDIRLIVSEGMGWGPFRQTAALWDYGPYDVSACLDLMGKLPDGIAALGTSLDGKDDCLVMRLQYPNIPVWISLSRLGPRRRRFQVFTNTTMYTIDDRSETPLLMREGEFDERFFDESKVIPVPKTFPADEMLLTFLHGIQNGDRSSFGIKLAVDVVKVLAACEAKFKRA